MLGGENSFAFDFRASSISWLLCLGKLLTTSSFALRVSCIFSSPSPCREPFSSIGKPIIFLVSFAGRGNIDSLPWIVSCDAFFMSLLLGDESDECHECDKSD